MQTVHVGSIPIGNRNPLVLIAGPCVIESEDLVLKTADGISKITKKLGIPLIFKSSFDKANRSSIESFRGPGLDGGLKILQKVRDEIGIPILSDVHWPSQCESAGSVLDVLQIPAFLCRQTDLLLAAGETGKPVNIKKGQFVAPKTMKEAAKKVESTGNLSILLTERGTTFGYHNLVVDMRSLQIMRSLNHPVIFDATHSVQLPSAGGTKSGGERAFVPLLTRAAISAGIDALFMEVHPDPNCALCDGPNMWPLDQLESLLKPVLQIHQIVQDL